MCIQQMQPTYVFRRQWVPILVRWLPCSTVCWLTFLLWVENMDLCTAVFVLDHCFCRLGCALVTFIIHSNVGPDLQNILRQSYVYLTIMPKLRSTYDSLIHKTSYEGHKAFLGYSLLAKSWIVWDSVGTLAYDIPKKNLRTLLVTIVSRSYGKLKIILW